MRDNTRHHLVPLGQLGSHILNKRFPMLAHWKTQIYASETIFGNRPLLVAVVGFFVCLTASSLAYLASVSLKWPWKQELATP